ncbi:MAG: threonine--tRNA ligase [Patescibacteria group bacterium]|nr:MAG: threonine--tRNA ligase [Patescibacteria group bacterium]
MKNNLDNLRHTTSHLLAAAVLELYPYARITLGPPIENGFYYDIDFGNDKISEEDLPKIEKKMRQLVKNWTSVEGKEISIDEAKKLFKNNQYKLELIEEITKKGEKITIYKSGNFIDLCRGGHIKNPSQEIKHFKLLSIAGAYWRGNEKNKMLTRIYGTVFPTKEELDKYLWQLEEAKKRDHKKIGKELKLFILPQDVGSGLLIWSPYGAIIRRKIEELIINEQTKRGYLHVYTPHIGKKTLWQTSGHWDLYRDKMYAPMKIDEDEYLVKPMNCPFHMMVYKSELRSYKDLPLRIAEIATVYRYEKAGELSGMLRVRHITQDDSHIFCREDQVVDEFLGVFDYMIYLLNIFGLKDYYFRLGLRSPKEKYLGNDEIWIKAEKEIVKAIEKKGLNYIKSEGDAAFYGPKLDVIIKDAIGRQWQCGTIQVDFMLPERFGLEYIDENGKIQRPALIHRAPLGSLERFVAILIEHYAGAFPLWLSPVQIAILPVSEKFVDHANKLAEIFQKNNLRIENNFENETLSKKIRSATLKKIPYLVIIGEKEVNGLSLEEYEKNGLVAIRTREGKDLGQININQFILNLNRQIETFS